MVEIIGVRFKSGGKQYYFDPAGLEVQPGQGVIVETSRGLEYGECAQGNTQVEEETVVQPLRPLVRIATEEDEKTVEKNREKEPKAFQICQEKIAAHGLEMKLVEAEYSFEGNKVLFFFTAEGRVDFRALVKDLASTIHARIELRQIGVRDEAKMLGGLGICGRPFCCAQFLDEFQPVSIKMAKTQNLSLNPTKISGTCGRLMCCLKYEQEAYEDLVKHTPKQESFVETPDGAGTVSSVNLLRQQVQVRLDSAPDTPKCYHNCEICVVRNGKGKRPEGWPSCAGRLNRRPPRSPLPPTHWPPPWRRCSTGSVPRSRRESVPEARARGAAAAAEAAGARVRPAGRAVPRVRASSAPEESGSAGRRSRGTRSPGQRRRRASRRAESGSPAAAGAAGPEGTGPLRDQRGMAEREKKPRTS